MKSTKITPQIQRALADIQKQYPVVQAIFDEINAYRGRVLFVGGMVRDLLLGIPITDIDIEVHGMPLEELEALLNRFGQVNLVGKSFGVLRYPGLDIDWAVPRSDSSGRKPKVKLDPNMSITDAFARRDLTMNAMGIDARTGELLDPFGGQADLEAKILRAPNAERFKEDPLRFFRVMQFMSRFEMQPAPELNEICKRMDISSVSRERMEIEFEKLLLKSKRPSLGLRWLKDIERLSQVLPELAATIGIVQGSEYHPEGYVFEHTMQTIDAAAQMKYENDHIKLLVLYAALCHDLGKVTTTEVDEDGSVTSIGHAQEGYQLTRRMLKRITHNKDVIDTVSKLVKYHMSPIQFIDNDAASAAYKRLAHKLAPHASLALLADLALADKRGRNAQGHEPLKKDFPEIAVFRKRAQEAQVLEAVEKPLLQGKDIADLVEAGPKMGELLRRAYELQIDEGITDRDVLRQRLIELIHE